MENGLAPCQSTVVAALALAVLAFPPDCWCSSPAAPRPKATGCLTDVTIDVGDTHGCIDGPSAGDVDGVFPIPGAQNFTIESTTKMTPKMMWTRPDDDNGGIETTSSGSSNGRPGAISIVESTGRINIRSQISPPRGNADAGGHHRKNHGESDATIRTAEPLITRQVRCDHRPEPVRARRATPSLNPYRLGCRDFKRLYCGNRDGTTLTSRAQRTLLAQRYWSTATACTTTGDSVKVALQNNS